MHESLPASNKCPLSALGVSKGCRSAKNCTPSKSSQKSKNGINKKQANVGVSIDRLYESISQTSKNMAAASMRQA
jgi:hypothetical protein